MHFLTVETEQMIQMWKRDILKPGGNAGILIASLHVPPFGRPPVRNIDQAAALLYAGSDHGWSVDDGWVG